MEKWRKTPVLIGALAMHAGCTECDGNGNVAETGPVGEYLLTECERLATAKNYVTKVLEALHEARWKLIQSNGGGTNYTEPGHRRFLYVEREWEPISLVNPTPEERAAMQDVVARYEGLGLNISEARVVSPEQANDQKINYMRNTPHAPQRGQFPLDHMCIRCDLQLENRIHDGR